jgi:hypothetical protein
MSQLKYWNGTAWVTAVVGAQGPTGDTGATGATGDTGPSGVIAVTAPITNSGTSTSASIGIDQTGITLAQSQVTNLETDLAAKANSVNVARWSGQTSTVVEVMPRIAMGATTLSTGTVYWSFFTPLVTTTISSIGMGSGSVIAVGLTLARMGLYTFDETTATLVARTASDTTLFTATNTLYTRSFDTSGGYPATYTLQAGQRYGLGLICVGTTMPTMFYGTVSVAYLAATTPRLNGVAGSLADLPTTRSSFTNNSAALYGRFS